DPIVARCPAGGGILVRTDLPEDGNLLIKADGDAHPLGGHGQFNDRCDLLDVGRSLSATESFTREPVTMRTTLVADTVAMSPVGGQVAVVKGGFPIEILSTAAADSLPKPWDVSPSESRVVTAFGERELIAQENGWLVSADASGVVDLIPVFGSSVLAAKPDGTGAVLTVALGKALLIVNGLNERLAVAECASAAVKYVPGRD